MTKFCTSHSRSFEMTPLSRVCVKLGADDPYVRAVRTGRTCGPDVRVVCTELKSLLVFRCNYVSRTVF